MDFFEAIGDAKTPRQLSDIFNALAQQDPQTRLDVIKAVEAEMLPQFEDNISIIQVADDIFGKLVDNVAQGTADQEDAETVQELFIDSPQMMEAVLIEVQKVRQEQSHPLVDAFLSKSLPLSAEERKTPQAWLKAMCSMQLPTP